MSLPLSYRAELANQVLAHLRRLDPAAWALAEARRAEHDLLHTMALRLAEHATDILAEEFGPELVAVVRARLTDVAGLAPPDGAIPAPVARGAVLAAFLRDSRGFNLGAFAELFRPVAPFIDFGAVERTAHDALVGGFGGTPVTETTRARDDAKDARRA